MKYVVCINKPATSACSNRNILLTRLTGRLHSSKFYSSKSLTTPFVKILNYQTFAPYSSFPVSGISPCLYTVHSTLDPFSTPGVLWGAYHQGTGDCHIPHVFGPDEPLLLHEDESFQDFLLCGMDDVTA